VSGFDPLMEFLENALTGGFSTSRRVVATLETFLEVENLLVTLIQ